MPRMPRRSCLLLTVLAACAPGGSEDSADSGESTGAGESTGFAEPGAGLYTVRVAHYEPVDPPAPLRIANETLLVPLGRGAKLQDLTREAPGDLVVAYTRIDCSVGDPNPFLADHDPAVPRGPEVRVRTIEVDELATDFDGTCFAVRVDGVWSLQTGPTAVEHRAADKTTTLALDSRADTVAIFFPLYADVTAIHYQIAE